MAMKSSAIRFSDEEFAAINKVAKQQNIPMSLVIREGVMQYVDPDKRKNYLSLANVAALPEGADIALYFGQFLDDFNHAKNKARLIKDEPVWSYDPGWWQYDFAAAAHKLAHENDLPVPRWVLKEEYIAPSPYFAFDTQDTNFQEYLVKTTPMEFKMHNLFVGENVLKRA